MPDGKPAGVRCVQLMEDERCALFGDPRRPAVCASLQANAEMCGATREHALRWLGDISYSTYLGHFFLFVLFKLAFVGADLQLGWAGLAGYLALVLAASAALYRGLEKPAQRWLNARAPAFAARPALR